MSIRVLLVDDQPLFRQGVRALLADAPDILVVGEAGDGVAGYEFVERLKPDLVLMDIRMPVCSGLEATRRIKADFPQTKVVMLTVSEEEEDFFSAIRSGADGYLLKDVDPGALCRLIREAMRGDAPLSPRIAGKLLRELRARPWFGPNEEREAKLTTRELEVLKLVAANLSNAEIALRLSLAEGTVKNHLHSILEKLHLESRLEATTYAIRHGLVEASSTRELGG